MNIKDNIISSILNIIKDDNLDCNKNIKILTLFYETKIDINSLKQNLTNLEIVEYKIENTSIDDINIDQYFDYIILFESIEKLIYYDIFLSNIKKYLLDSGTLICTIPNLMYKDVLSDILKGNFTYSNDGVLNKSNLRFFTLNEILALLDKERYDVNKVMGIVTNPTQKDEELINILCNISSEEFRLNFNANYYIISSNKKKNKTIYDYILN